MGLEAGLRAWLPSPRFTRGDTQQCSLRLPWPAFPGTTGHSSPEDACGAWSPCSRADTQVWDCWVGGGGMSAFLCLKLPTCSQRGCTMATVHLDLVHQPQAAHLFPRHLGASAPGRGHGGDAGWDCSPSEMLGGAGRGRSQSEQSAFVLPPGGRLGGLLAASVCRTAGGSPLMTGICSPPHPRGVSGIRSDSS